MHTHAHTLTHKRITHPRTHQAVGQVRLLLPRDAVLVGQNIGADVAWLGLAEGRDFEGMMDLQGLFRVWNDKVGAGGAGAGNAACVCGCGCVGEGWDAHIQMNRSAQQCCHCAA